MTRRQVERNETIEHDYLHGKSVRQIGEEWNLSTQRVYQIIRNERGPGQLNQTDKAMIKAGLERLEQDKPALRKYTRRAARKINLTLRDYS